jgi:tRNA-dihydrouridine synthase
MLDETGCDGIMIGRKAISDPDIFARVLARINGEEDVEESISRRFDLMLRYLKASVKYIGEEHACRMMRSRLGWFTKGMHKSSQFREAIKQLSSEAEGIELINAYRDDLRKLDKLVS